MLVTEYFSSGIKQRSAAFKINNYLADKNIDYGIYYNVAGLENILMETDKNALSSLSHFPKVFTSVMLKQYSTPGHFKDDSNLVIIMTGKNKEYNDIRDAFVIDQNFVDEHHTLVFQEHYIYHLAEEIKKQFKEIREDKRLGDRR